MQTMTEQERQDARLIKYMIEQDTQTLVDRVKELTDEVGRLCKALGEISTHKPPSSGIIVYIDYEKGYKQAKEIARKALEIE